MKPTSIIQRLVILLITLMSAIGANAQEAYACYTESNTTLTFYYDSQRDSREGTTYDLNTGEDDPGWSTDETYGKVTKVVFDPTFANARPTSTYGWFYFMFSLQSIEGISYLNTSEVTNMAWMFGYCTKLTSLDLSHFNTSKVNQMYDMFYGCENLQTIYVGNGWSTAELSINSVSLFYKCTSIVGGKGTTYDANHVDADYAHIDGGPSNPGYFTTPPEAYACYSSSNTTLTFYYDNIRDSREGTTFNLNSGGAVPAWYSNYTNASVTKVVFDPSFADARPTSTYGWFKDMLSLQTIEGMSYLNTSEVTTMSSMFYNCSKLTSLDLSSFNTAKVTSMGSMFWKCSNLQTIIVGDGWNTSAVSSSSNMFSYCAKLVGGQGTTYNGNYKDKTYAHIDGGTSNPGYFTTPPEAYACYTPSNTTLTFYYDSQRVSREGTTYDLNTESSLPGWRTDGIRYKVTKVVFDPSFADTRPTTTHSWFSDMTGLQSIEGMNYLNTSEVTDMSFMFYGCLKMTSFDLSHFNTTNVTNMNAMFSNCYKLASLDLSSFNTSKVSYMSNMFLDCYNLSVLDLSSFNTSKVTDMSYMFYSMSPTILDLGSFDTSNVTNMEYMFYQCRASELDLSSFNTSKVTNMQEMFAKGIYLETIYVSNGWNTDAVEKSTNMFSDCTYLEGGHGTSYNASHVVADYAHIDGGTSNPGYFTDGSNRQAYAVYTEENTTLTFYFDSHRGSWLGMGTTYDLNTGISYPGWVNNGTNAKVTKVVFDASFVGARPTSTYGWFSNMTNLQVIEGMHYLNTYAVTNMHTMFSNCSNLTYLDLSHFNTTNVTDMFSMFSGCNNLTRLNLSSFKTLNVTDMTGMFSGCSKLRTIYAVNGWSTAAVTNSNYMFSDCSVLVGGNGTTFNANLVDKTYAHIDGGSSNPGYFTEPKIEAYAVYTDENTTLTFYYDKYRSSRPGTTYDLNSGNNAPRWYSDGTYDNVTKVVFDPSFVDACPTTTYAWFYGMTNLTNIKGISFYFNTSEVTNMEWMFYYCSSLNSLDLSQFNTAKVTDMTNMFRECSNLQTIYVSDGWSTAAVTSSTNMFYKCNSLVGGKSTTYNDSNPTDKTYAHVDGGPSNPGYFTALIEAYACYTPSDNTLTFYYDRNRRSREGTTYDLNSGNTPPRWFSDGTYENVTKVVFEPTFARARPTTTYAWFYGMTNLTNIKGISYDLNTSEVTNMKWMFYYCSSLKSLDLGQFNTAKVTDMTDMFRECNNLRTIYVGDGWSTAAVTNSTNMFYECNSLVGGKGTTYNDSNPTDVTYAHIDGGTSNPGYFTAAGTEPYACYQNGTLTFYYDNLRIYREGKKYFLNAGADDPGWLLDGRFIYVTKVVFDPLFAVARPTTTNTWFYDMKNLETIEGMSYLNTSEVTDMAWMFRGCTKLASLDLSSFNTSKVTNMHAMFPLCTSFTSLDLSSFNTSNVTDMAVMFKECNNLRTIYVGDGWNTDDVEQSSNMFSNCTSLKGCKGTTYNDSNPKDMTYAHIDGGPSYPGYFTARNTGIATDLHQVTSDKQQVQSDEWYTIDGRKLNGMPAKKGVYIQNGQKRIIK